MNKIPGRWKYQYIKNLAWWGVEVVEKNKPPRLKLNLRRIKS